MIRMIPVLRILRGEASPFSLRSVVP